MIRGFRSAVKENCLFEILEQVVVYEGEKEEILAVAQLAKRCLKINARKRPSMKEVAAELEQLRKKKEVPGYQESFQDENRAMSENCYSSGIDSQAKGDQTCSE
ncbi:UNVERIFIED_CONTAM: Wall-associated receptor kinase [Sesamum latifolium]|uniref:Wall-associated receptor kinase n=1 Tax=Sesamum latifolium TaxID=2727402 RepID=A0AAW2TSC0_9LAMI